MIKIARTFAWEDIGEDLLKVLGGRKFTRPRGNGASDMEMLLLVTGGLDDGVAKQALINASMAREDYVIRSREAVEVLWSAVRSGDTQTVDLITTRIQEKEPHELGHFVGVFSHYINDYGEVSELHVLKTIASKRKEWLKQEMEKLDKVRISLVRLDGTIQKFSGPREAKEQAKWRVREGQKECSFTAQAGEDINPFVTFTKTRKWFEDSQVKPAQYKEELARLSESY
ncbi:hypothetical protein JG687_00016992 [Phytophthora cactorum]|uniref:Uncharacterized protein n=1 Tax=Phytophthora cactorum TaxID=29920 RepID=A0A329SLQ5_9STRA|nr:hypothetical protein PC111_g21899 [Phytophthora cactorum]KAG2796362.1 hypothetical protein PC112_g22234 [Phytophthora cactorum]KAG2823826.1 hypothetical protein PC113_g22130 [Phytophthora cactorum]KAG2875407.1 hypothetical protein PC114_g24749 [Phytophthora cactorum]KAG2882176.1 hypothetical protein PC115_g22024 [Phytophthora cactorum]